MIFNFLFEDKVPLTFLFQVGISHHVTYYKIQNGIAELYILFYWLSEVHLYVFVSVPCVHW